MIVFFYNNDCIKSLINFISFAWACVEAKALQAPIAEIQPCKIRRDN